MLKFLNKSNHASTLYILISPAFPKDYELSEEGDSGALWMTDGGFGVALHQAGNAYGAQSATGTRLAAVLAALRLQLV